MRRQMHTFTTVGTTIPTVTEIERVLILPTVLIIPYMYIYIYTYICIYINAYINIKFNNGYLALFRTSVNSFCLPCNNCKIINNKLFETNKIVLNH